ncbi:hypothetical protein ASG84_01975 [Rhodococcus sp. Leaf278]|nr:hypothetical protein ASG84_01975 [Rhodococcus sp. Leaf278]
MELLAIALSGAAAVLSFAGLVVMWLQLRIAENVAGGRGVYITACPTGIHTSDSAGRGSREFIVRIELIGQGARHHTALSLVGVTRKPDGDRPIRDRMDSDSEPMEWRVTIFDGDDISDAWWIFSWADAHGDGLLTNALRIPLDQDGRGIEHWTWKRFTKARYRFQKEGRWYLPGSGHARPLGEWKTKLNMEFRENQGPIPRGLSR